MAIWSKGAIENDLLRRRAQESQAASLGRNPLPGDTYSLPKRQFNRRSNQSIMDERQNSFMQRLASIREMGDFDPVDTVSPYIEQAEDLIFRAGKVNDRIQKKLSNPKIKKVPYEYDVNVPMPYSVPVAGKPGTVKIRGTNKTQKVDANGLPVNLVPKEHQIGNQGGGNFNAFVNAISGKESGGNYSAVNPDSGAMGKYQIMPANIAGPGGWDMEALGRNITPQQFLSSPQLQEQIARFKLKQYYEKYGAAGAASAWYSGDPNKWKTSTVNQGGYPSIRAYVQSILKALGG